MTTRQLATALTVALAACGRDAPPAPVMAPASHDLEVRGGAEAPVRVDASGPRDLWPLCDAAGVVAIAAVAGGQRVQGSCADRAGRSLTARLDAAGGVVVELRRDGASGPIVAALAGVDHVELGATAPASTVVVVPLPMTIDGRALAPLSPTDDDAATMTSDAPSDPDSSRQKVDGGQHHRLGRSLREAMAAAGIDVATLTSVSLVSGAGAPPPLDAAWWRDATHDVRLRTNRRGQWRASLIDARGETAKIADVTAIDLSSRLSGAGR